MRGDGSRIVVHPLIGALVVEWNLHIVEQYKSCSWLSITNMIRLSKGERNRKEMASIMWVY